MAKNAASACSAAMQRSTVRKGISPRTLGISSVTSTRYRPAGGTVIGQRRQGGGGDDRGGEHGTHGMGLRAQGHASRVPAVAATRNLRPGH